MYFGRPVSMSYEVQLDGKAMKWTNDCLYLGVLLRTGKVFNCAITERVNKADRHKSRAPSNQFPTDRPTDRQTDQLTE